MKRIKSKLNLFALSLLGVVALGGCANTIEPPIKPPKDPRQYTFTIDTLVPPEIPQTVMVAMWGTGRNNLYVVGHNAGFGRSIYHFDGQKWSGVGLKLGEGGSVTNIGALYNIYGFADNDIYAVGDRWYHETEPPYTISDSSLILHFNGSAWTQMETPEGRTIVGVWGVGPNDIWAGGTYGTLFHYDGRAWSSVGNFASNMWFARFAGFSSNDVYALCYSIPDSANVWHHYYMWHWDGSNWALLDSFVETDNNRFGSEALNVIDGRLYSAGSGVFKMSGGSWNRVNSLQQNMIYACIKGTSSRNMFAAGYPGLLVHFNGTDWYQYAQLSALAFLFCDAWTDGNELFVVGHDGWSTYIIHGQ